MNLLVLSKQRHQVYLLLRILTSVKKFSSEAQTCDRARLGQGGGWMLVPGTGLEPAGLAALDPKSIQPSFKEPAWLRLHGVFFDGAIGDDLMRSVASYWALHGLVGISGNQPENSARLLWRFFTS
jgi:hypothetical protein